ncbi:hypothetical protein ODJ79_19785 [Actinoplanes sp. KI2]|uniref:hypothetical protein n=1 Tax=Actinoplanes sp. KI2 TaxID=2983315 RepID=UPI0021D580D3|nr:hypothetical protein [Actinoplanes sp. KI2]MCU7725971.1 hypothetical protein [Actinoplanes sp. KI2]
MPQVERSAAVSALSWQPLGGSGDTVLAMDFAVGRKGAGFEAVAAGLSTSFAVFLSTFQPGSLESLSTGPTPAAERFTRDIRTSCAGLPPVRAVIGYCAGSAFACHAADTLADGGHRPPVVLLDPATATPATIWERYVEAMNGLKELLPAERIDQELARTPQDPAAALPAYAATLAGTYRALVTEACDLLGAADLAVQLGTHVADALHYQAVAGAIGGNRRGAVVFTSKGFVPEPPYAPADVAFDVAYADLLRDDAVVRAVVDAVSAERGPRSPIGPVA